MPSREDLKPLVRKVDHIVISSALPEKLFSLFTQVFGLPVVWPLAPYPGFTSGGFFVGNVNIETIRFGKTDAMSAGTQSALSGIVFEPFPLDSIIPELSARGLRPGPKLPMETEFHGRKIKMWTNMMLEGLSMKDYLVYLCEYMPDYQGSIEKTTVFPKGLGEIGLLAIKHINIGTRDYDSTNRLWDTFLAPWPKDHYGAWMVGDGPGIKLTPADTDGIISLTLQVESLQKAESFLQNHNLMGDSTSKTLKVSRAKIQNINIEMVE